MVEEGKEAGGSRTKEEAQQELREKFGIAETSEFWTVLQKGEIAKAEEWLRYIVDHKEDFPQYRGTWDSWLADRQKEIAFYKEYQEKIAAGEAVEKITPRTKAEAQADLLRLFGMAKTSAFRDVLKKGEIEKAKAWLQYIIDNRFSFPQYLVNWDSWLADREREIAETENK
jgi:hypothetical protein